MTVCKFFAQGYCKFGNTCKFEHPANAGNTSNRYAPLQGQHHDRNQPPRGGNRDGRGFSRREWDYHLDPEIIKNDLINDRPIWPLSAYGPGRDAPRQLIEGPIEMSPEELRLQFYMARASGNEQAGILHEQELASKAQQQIDNVLKDLEGACQYIVDGAKQHPNRIDMSNSLGPTAGIFSTENRARSNINAPTGPAGNQPRPMFGTSSFGQPSAPGAPQTTAFGKPSAPGFAQPSFGQTSSFGQPSGLGQTAAFGKPSMPGQVSTFGQPGQTTAFGQPSAPAQTSLFGKPSTPGQTSAFGQPSTPGQTTAFGQPSAPGQTSAFGRPSFPGQASTFGQPSNPGQTSSFGRPSNLGAPSTFGQPQPPGAAAPNPSPFAQQGQTTSSFGQPSTFGQPTTFGQPSNPAPTGAFGQPSTTAPPTGLFGRPTAPTTNFGQPSAPSPTSFGKPSNDAAPNPFNRPALLSGSGANVSSSPVSATMNTSDFASAAFTNGTTSLSPASGNINTAVKDASGRLQTWKGNRVQYINNHPHYQHSSTSNFPGGNSNQNWERIWFPDGYPGPYPAAEDRSEEYEGEKGKMLEEVYRICRETGKFPVDATLGISVMPEIPPKREWIRWDI